MNLNKGRKPVFTPELARSILEFRKQFEAGRSCAFFIDRCVEEGFLNHPCSIQTMSRLLNGSTFPTLTDAEGCAFDYGSLPRLKRGRPPQVGVDLTLNGEPKPKFSKLRQTLIDAAIRAALEWVESRQARQAKRETEVNQLLEGLRTRVADLERGLRFPRS